MTLEEELRKHVEQCDARFERIDGRVTDLIASQERLCVALETIAKDTHGVVELYKSAQGAITVGVSIQKFGLWLIKWPLIGTGLFTAYKWITEYSKVT